MMDPVTLAATVMLTEVDGVPVAALVEVDGAAGMLPNVFVPGDGSLSDVRKVCRDYGYAFYPITTPRCTGHVHAVLTPIADRKGNHAVPGSN